MKRVFVLFFLCAISFVAVSQEYVNIGSFNIQNFGKTKLSKKLVVDTLVYIVRQFDVIAIQEISDISNKIPERFLKILNDGGKYNYKYVCSPRTGLQKNDKTSQEQYAFYYNSETLILNDAELFDDNEYDLFQREPYVASFTTKKANIEFIICTIHTAPEKALSEIGSLNDVSTWISNRFNNYNNIIFCGDFNASCSYASNEELQKLTIHKKPYNWIISDTTKTNLSNKTNCAYDRFVVSDPIMPMIKNCSVLRCFKSKAVSDHWPISLKLFY